MCTPVDSWDIIMLDSEADMKENEASEVVQLRLIVNRQDEERKLMMDEIAQLKGMLKREVGQAELENKTKAAIITDYKMIRHRLETQLSAVRAEVDLLKAKIIQCKNCSAYLDCNNSISDDQTFSLARTRELELQLAKAKLAQVEAECKNQDLTHQLRSTENELSTAKNSWPPWLSKTLSSIKEVANKKDFSQFTYPHSNIPNTPSFVSHINSIRRDSAPSNAQYDHFNIRSDTIKDSQSCSSLKSHN